MTASAKAREGSVPGSQVRPRRGAEKHPEEAGGTGPEQGSCCRGIARTLAAQPPPPCTPRACCRGHRGPSQQASPAIQHGHPFGGSGPPPPEQRVRMIPRGREQRQDKTGEPWLPRRLLPSASGCRCASSRPETRPRGPGGSPRQIYLQALHNVIVRDLGGHGLDPGGAEGGLEDLVS